MLYIQFDFDDQLMNWSEVNARRHGVLNHLRTSTVPWITVKISQSLQSVQFIVFYCERADFPHSWMCLSACSNETLHFLSNKRRSPVTAPVHSWVQLRAFSNTFPHIAFFFPISLFVLSKHVELLNSSKVVNIVFYFIELSGCQEGVLIKLFVITSGCVGDRVPLRALVIYLFFFLFSFFSPHSAVMCSSARHARNATSKPVCARH